MKVVEHSKAAALPRSYVSPARHAAKPCIRWLFIDRLHYKSSIEVLQELHVHGVFMSSLY